MSKTTSTAQEKITQFGRAVAMKLGLADDDEKLWAELRAAIENGDESAVERLQSKLGLTPRHVEFCRLAIDIHERCAEAREIAAKAAKRLEVIEGEVEMLSRMAPGTVAEATKLAARRQELMGERQRCVVAMGAHDAHSDVDGFVPELFGHPRGKIPYAGCNNELLNFARQHFDVNPYIESWLKMPSAPTPTRRVKVRAAK
jgi:hypothetical protein